MCLFTNAGPVDCARHDCLDPVGRFDLPRLKLRLKQAHGFVLHAPRQNGKTFCLMALAAHLSANVETGQGPREDLPLGLPAIRAEPGARPRHQPGSWNQRHNGLATEQSVCADCSARGT